MSRYTVDLSRAKSYSRRKRASKAVSILRDYLENAADETVSISPEVNREIWGNGAENPPTSIEVELTETSGGKVAVLPDSESVDEEPETTDEQTGDEQEETGSDTDAGEQGTEEFEQVVSGTVSEAKDRIEEMDKPDLEAILEAEKKGKDRKTLKNWLEERIE